MNATVETDSDDFLLRLLRREDFRIDSEDDDDEDEDEERNSLPSQVFLLREFIRCSRWEAITTSTRTPQRLDSPSHRCFRMVVFYSLTVCFVVLSPKQVVLQAVQRHQPDQFLIRNSDGDCLWTENSSFNIISIRMMPSDPLRAALRPKEWRPQAHGKITTLSRR
jgi:hypothetical protein